MARIPQTGHPQLKIPGNSDQWRPEKNAEALCRFRSASHFNAARVFEISP
jgi:hypothetical protein